MMTQEDKELLIKDLCARLPYGVKCYISELNDYRVLGSIQYDGINTLFDFWNKEQTRYELQLYISEFKPCLFTISSMTEEQEAEWDDLYITPLAERMDHRHTRKEDLMLRAKAGYAAIFWLLENHFDYLGLIEKGLAIDATVLNIY